MTRGLMRLGLCMLAVALNGCALFSTPAAPEAPDKAAWLERRAEYSRISQWTVRARMATALFGWSGSLQWQQQEDDLQLAVSGPLGLGGFRAQGSLQHVEVETSDQKRLSGDPERLFRDVVGWHFPLRGMRYWALGLPVPGKPAAPVLDARGRLSELQQDGWQLRYQEYRQYGAAELPRRIRLEKGDLTIRIVIDDWKLAAGT